MLLFRVGWSPRRRPAVPLQHPPPSHCEAPWLTLPDSMPDPRQYRLGRPAAGQIAIQPLGHHDRSELPLQRCSFASRDAAALRRSGKITEQDGHLLRRGTSRSGRSRRTRLPRGKAPSYSGLPAAGGQPKWPGAGAVHQPRGHRGERRCASGEGRSRAGVHLHHRPAEGARLAARH
jgi:hypothetical protein